MPIPTTRVVAGTLPPGLQMSGRGDVEGIPTTPGVFAFSVEVSDGCARRVEQRQIRVMPAPILTAEAETQEFRCVHGAPPFSGGIVRVSGSAPGRAYSVDILNAPWLQATMRDGALPPEGSAFEADTLQLTVDPGKLTAGTYTARLRISTWQGANTPELRFQLHVASPQTVLTPISTAPPAPIAVNLPDVVPPSPRLIVPPAVPHQDPPKFPKYHPKPKPVHSSGGAHVVGRSRVLPFPKVVLPPKAAPAAKAPVAVKPPAKPEAKPEAKQPPKTVAKAETKKEAPPERTKPSAMPPAAKH